MRAPIRADWTLGDPSSAPSLQLCQDFPWQVENNMNDLNEAPRRSTDLLETLAPFESIVVVTHDNPDPDAIAAGWAIKELVEKTSGRPVRLIGGGGIVRAENQQMVRLLEAPIELLETVEVDREAAAILVDCQFDGENHLLVNSSIHPVGVIDHHAETSYHRTLPFEDLRPEVAASATIAGSYLREQGLEPSDNLATALIYAIRTETQGSETRHTDLDRKVIAWLTKWADPSKLAEIQNAPLAREYYSDLVLALQSTFLFDHTALCFLPQAQGAEIVGEVADLLIRCEDIRQVLCAAVIGSGLYLSVRTDRNAGNAATLVRETLKGIGQGGGHDHRAGGRIELIEGRDLAEVQRELQRRWLATCQVTEGQALRLVSTHQIVSNL